MSDPLPPAAPKVSNRQIALAIISLVVLMAGISFLSVPLYSLFCRMTGYGGTPQMGGTAVPGKIYDRTVTVSFLTDTDPSLPWDFKAEQHKVTVKVGQTALVNFTAHNRTARPTAGAAIYNVTPDKIGKYFYKTQCFCFQEQMLNPGAIAHFPVMFYIDPSILNDKSVRDVTDITLSYTFYPADSKNLDAALERYYSGQTTPTR